MSETPRISELDGVKQDLRENKRANLQRSLDAAHSALAYHEEHPESDLRQRLTPDAAGTLRITLDQLNAYIAGQVNFVVPGADQKPIRFEIDLPVGAKNAGKPRQIVIEKQIFGREVPDIEEPTSVALSPNIEAIDEPDRDPLPSRVSAKLRARIELLLGNIGLGALVRGRKSN